MPACQTGPANKTPLNWAPHNIANFFLVKNLAKLGHISPDEVKEKLVEKKIDVAVIPGGCTRAVQAPDVVWNGPFKSHLNAEYDEWINNSEIHSYTKSGHLRSPSRTQLCDMIVRAWNKISKEMIIKSFRVCGQVRDIQVEEITAFKDGRCAEAGRVQLKKLLELDPTEIDYELLDKQLLPPPVSVTVTESVEMFLDDAVEQQEEDIFADIGDVDQTLEDPEPEHNYEVVVDNFDNVIFEPMDIGDAIFDIFL